MNAKVLRSISSNRVFVVASLSLFSVVAQPIFTRSQVGSPQRSTTSAPQVSTSQAQAGPLVEIPFVYRDGRISVSARMGKDAAHARIAPVLRLIVDTGSPVSCINRTSFHNKKLELYDPKNAAEFMAADSDQDKSGEGALKVYETYLSLGRFNAKIHAIVVANEDSSRPQIEEDGLLGADFLSSYVVEIDHEKGVIRIYDPDKFRTPPPADRFVKLPLALGGGTAAIKPTTPLIEADVTPFGAPSAHLTLYLDTGDPGYFTLYSPFVARHDWQNYLKDKVTFQRQTLTDQATAVQGRVQSCRIGTLIVNELPTTFSFATTGIMADKSADGQFGDAFLSRYTIILDYPRKALYLRSTKLAAIPFPESYYFGLDLVASATKTAGYTLESVDKGSPAEVGGLRAGDVIRKINGKSVVGGSFNDVKKLAGLRGAKCELEFTRGPGAARHTVTLNGNRF